VCFKKSISLHEKEGESGNDNERVKDKEERDTAIDRRVRGGTGREKERARIVCIV
jgi:hypothetical protein